MSIAREGEKEEERERERQREREREREKDREKEGEIWHVKSWKKFLLYTGNSKLAILCPDIA